MDIYFFIVLQRSEIKKYIIEISKIQNLSNSVQTCQRILACLALLLFAKKYKLFSDMKKIHNGYCDSLFLHGVDEVDIHLLTRYVEKYVFILFFL